MTLRPDRETGRALGTGRPLGTGRGALGTGRGHSGPGGSVASKTILISRMVRQERVLYWGRHR